MISLICSRSGGYSITISRLFSRFTTSGREFRTFDFVGGQIYGVTGGVAEIGLCQITSEKFRAVQLAVYKLAGGQLTAGKHGGRDGISGKIKLVEIDFLENIVF